MIIVVACDGLDVAPCFNGAECYCCYSAARGVLSGSRTLPNLRFSAKKMAETLASFGASVVICGSATASEVKAFESVGVEVLTGVSGSASDAASGYLARTLRGAEGDLDDED